MVLKSLAALQHLYSMCQATVLPASWKACSQKGQVCQMHTPQSCTCYVSGTSAAMRSAPSFLSFIFWSIPLPTLENLYSTPWGTDSSLPPWSPADPGDYQTSQHQMAKGKHNNKTQCNVASSDPTSPPQQPIDILIYLKGKTMNLKLIL